MSEQRRGSFPYCFIETQAEPRDVTCVHAALGSVDPELLLCVLLQTRLAWKVDPCLLRGSAKRHLMRKTESMLGLMHDIEPSLLEMPDAVVVPVQTFEYPGSGCAIRRTVSAALLDVSQSKDAQGPRLDYARSITECATHEPRGASEEGSSQVPWLQPIDGLVCQPWSYVLGLPLWLPSSLVDYEHVSVLAHVFWVMAFSGFAEAVNEMRGAYVGNDSGKTCSHASVATCFELHESKMEEVAVLMNHNSMVDAQGMAERMRRLLVA